jgi:hypothetical protein
MKKCSGGNHLACGICLKKEAVKAYEGRYRKYI